MVNTVTAFFTVIFWIIEQRIPPTKTTCSNSKIDPKCILSLFYCHQHHLAGSQPPSSEKTSWLPFIQSLPSTVYLHKKASAHRINPLCSSWPPRDCACSSSSTHTHTSHPGLLPLSHCAPATLFQDLLHAKLFLMTSMCSIPLNRNCFAVFRSFLIHQSLGLFVTPLEKLPWSNYLRYYNSL